MKAVAKWLVGSIAAATVGLGAFGLYNMQILMAGDTQFRGVVARALETNWPGNSISGLGSAPDCFQVELHDSRSRLDPRAEEALRRRLCVAVPVLPPETACNPIVSELSVEGLRILQTNRTVLTVLLAGTEEQRHMVFDRLQDTTSWIPSGDWFPAATGGLKRGYDEMDMQFTLKQCSNYGIIEVTAKLAD